MLFNSLTFAIFLPIVLAGYYSLNRRMQNAWLLAASYVFYGWWDYRFLSLLAVSTVVDYFCAKVISRSSSHRIRKLAVQASLLSNLGILGFFKYFDFFVESANAALTSVGLESFSTSLNIILPVGISFYTFQTLAYTIDVYRGRMEVCDRLLDFALYVSFFPQLVAGPIERATHLLPQLQHKRRVNGQDVNEGLFLIILGLFKKVGVSNAVASTVDIVFTQPNRFDAMTLLIGLYFFSMQIYCDFSGYSDIARGTSRLLGIDLMVNFNQPYFSTSITEFWRRWHISLSTWLRDYLYFSMGGNRGGRLRTYRNLFVTMLLGGLWHGAAWTFVVWGFLHGLYLAIHKMIMSRVEPTTEGSCPTGSWRKTVGVLKMLVTFHLVALTWIFFRAGSFQSALQYITRIATWKDGKDWIGEFEMLRFGILVSIVLAIDYWQWRAGSHEAPLKSPWYVRGLLYAVILVFLVLLGGIDSDVPFIYFQF